MPIHIIRRIALIAFFGGIAGGIIAFALRPADEVVTPEPVVSEEQDAALRELEETVREMRRQTEEMRREADAMLERVREAHDLERE